MSYNEYQTILSDRNMALAKCFLWGLTCYGIAHGGFYATIFMFLRSALYPKTDPNFWCEMINIWMPTILTAGAFGTLLYFTGRFSFENGMLAYSLNQAAKKMMFDK